MGHVIRDKQKLLNRVRRIRGQVEAIERALDGEAGCAQIMHQIAGCRGAINILLVEVSRITSALIWLIPPRIRRRSTPRRRRN